MVSKPETGSMSVKKKSVLVTAATIAIFFVIFAFVPFEKTVESLKNLRLSTVLLVLFISTAFNSIVYADRWRRSLAYVGIPLPLTEVMKVHVATGPVRLLLPVQTGELLTATALAKRAGVSIMKVIGTIMYNKLLTLAATLILLVGGLASGVSEITPLLGITAGTGLAVVVILLAFEMKATRNLFVKGAARINRALGEKAKKLLASFEYIPPRAKLFLLLYSIFFQFSEVISCYLIFRDLGISIPFGQLVVYVQILILASTLPISIAGIGTREGVALILLSQISSPESAVAAGIAYSFFEYLWPLVMGLPFIATVGMETFRLEEGAGGEAAADEEEEKDPSD